MTLEQLLSEIKNGSGMNRIDAARELGKLGDKGATDALIAALKDPSMGVRNNSAFSLGELGASGAVPWGMGGCSGKQPDIGRLAGR